MGAVALRVNVAFAPGLIGEEGKPTRPKPQVALSCGLCEPRLCGVEPPLLTSGDEAANLADFLGSRTHYAAADVIAWLLGGAAA